MSEKSAIYSTVHAWKIYNLIRSAAGKIYNLIRSAAGKICDFPGCRAFALFII